MPSEQVEWARFSGFWPVPAVGHWGLTRQWTISILLPHPDPALLLNLMGLLMEVRMFVPWFWLSQCPWTRHLHSIFLLHFPVQPSAPGMTRTRPGILYQVSHFVFFVFLPPCPANVLTPAEDSPSQAPPMEIKNSLQSLLTKVLNLPRSTQWPLTLHSPHIVVLNPDTH